MLGFRGFRGESGPKGPSCRCMGIDRPPRTGGGSGAPYSFGHMASRPQLPAVFHGAGISSLHPLAIRLGAAARQSHNQPRPAGFVGARRAAAPRSVLSVSVRGSVVAGRARAGRVATPAPVAVGPLAGIVYALVVRWYIEHGRPARDVARVRRYAPWYRRKQHPSFADMLAALRRRIWSECFRRMRLSDRIRQKLDQALSLAGVAA